MHSRKAPVTSPGKENMNLTKTETTRLMSVKRELEAGYDEGKLKPFRGIPYLLKDATSCYQSIIHDSTHVGTTLASENKAYFEKRGFYVAEIGIGYIVSIRRQSATH